MHPIERFIAGQRGQQKRLAQNAGLSPQHLNDIIKGRAPCGRRAAVALQKATGGAVTIQELIEFYPLVTPRRKKAAKKRAGKGGRRGH